MWRRPTLTWRVRHTTIGSAGLNFRVRDENGWVPCDMITTMVECLFKQYSVRTYTHNWITKLKLLISFHMSCNVNSYILVLTNNFPKLCDQALDLLVSVSSMHCCTYTPDLSTLSSTRSLTVFLHGISYLEVGFTLRCFQRLSSPHFATRQCRWHNNRYTIGAFILVLSY